MSNEKGRTRSSLRSSHQSSTTRSSTDLESLRLSLTSDFEAPYHPTSTWNPICSVQSSGSLSFAEELEAIDLQKCDDDDSFLTQPAADIDTETITSRRREDPPETGECDALVRWTKRETTEESSTAQELSSSSDPPSSCDGDDHESDVEPCEEHYRLPLAKDKAAGDEVVLLDDQVVCQPKADPPHHGNSSAQVDKSKQDLIHRINTQLALVPPSSSPLKYNGYKHHFITVEEKHRFLLLYNFLKRNLNSKIILYFGTAKSTQFHGRLLKRLQFDVKYAHNRQSKGKFLEEYLAFSRQKRGVLCLPDCQNEFAVPPTVSWIVQYEPPRDPTEYIFRIGRISHGGKALLFLTPRQFSFLRYFKAAQVKYYEYEMHNLSNVQRHYEKLIRRDDGLRKLGKEAYCAYLLDYASHEYRDVYDVHEIDKEDVARSFGFGISAPIMNGLAGSGGGGGTREDNKWKPNKKESGDSWMNREDRSWRYANRHCI